MPGTKPTKKELARIKVMREMGESPTAIARRIGRSHNTVIKYLRSDVYENPDIKAIVDRMREKELEDLWLLNAKARKNLHDMLDKGKGGMIPTIALMDRSFTQRRLLEGNSTSHNLIEVITEAHKRARDITPTSKEEGKGNAEGK